MFEEMLSRSYYGNSISSWLQALGIMVGAVLAGRLAYWVFGNII